MYIVNEGVKIAEIGQGRALAYIQGSGQAINLSQIEYCLYLEIKATNFSDPETFANKIDSSLTSVYEALSNLKEYAVITDVKPVEQRKEKFRFLQRVDKYLFKIGKATDLPLISFSISSPRWRHWGIRFTPYLLVISLVAVYGFYFSPVRPLGKIISDDFFYAPSIYEAFSLFTITNFLTAIYKIAVGSGTKYGKDTLYLRFLAGFNPVFETDEDVGYMRSLKCSRREYFYYVAAPTVLRVYLLVLCIALVYLFYPFFGSISSRFLSLIFTTINISWMALIWQVIPSPGTLAVKVMEIYGIIPFKYLGPSVKRLILYATQKDSETDKVELTKSALYVGMTLLLILLKIAFLGFWVLPQISIGIPHFLGQWTSQIVILILGYLSFRYLTYTVKPKGISDKNIGKAVGKEVNRHINSLFHRLGSKTKLYLLIALVLFFPFGSSISGVARVQENMSLDIKSSEPETVVVTKILKTGPSSSPVLRGDKILELSSEGLNLRLNQAKENLIALEQDQEIILNERDSLLEGGSVYENSKNKTEDVVISTSSIKALQAEKISLLKQLDILQSQSDTYKQLAKVGIVSRIQYQDKLLEYEASKIKYSEAVQGLESALASGRKAIRDEKVEQTLRIGEELKSKTSELRQVRASIAKENAELTDLENRINQLIINAPFDCVIESDTSLLEGKSIGIGEEIISVKAVPTQRVTVAIAEYDRNEISIDDPVEIRLYSKIFSKNTGYLYGYIDAISPVSEIDKDQEQIEVNVRVGENLSDSMLGASGIGKIRSGFTCLLFNILRPLARFVEVDLWQYVP